MRMPMVSQTHIELHDNKRGVEGDLPAVFTPELISVIAGVQHRISEDEQLKRERAELSRVRNDEVVRPRYTFD